GGLRTERSRNVSDEIIVIWVVLLENVDKLVSREVDTLVITIVSHVIDHRRGGQTTHNFSRISVKNNQFSWIACAGKQPVTYLVQSYRSRLLCFAQGPGC